MQKCDFGADFWRVAAVSGAGRREGRGSWKLLARCKNLELPGTGFGTLTPLQAGGGGFEGLRPTRRPKQMDNCTNPLNMEDH